jgi:hypothetical protein
MSSVVLTGDTSGAGTITVPAVAGTFTATIGSATGTHYPFTAGTAVASTSGTSIDFTSIPSWVKRITVMLNGVSTNGSSVSLIQLGSGSVQTSGYGSNGSNLIAGVSTASYSTGFGLASSQSAGFGYCGSAVFTLLGSNIWTMTFVGIAVAGSAQQQLASGSVTLGGALDRVRITTVNGTDMYDAGSINIMYE